MISQFQLISFSLILQEVSKGKSPSKKEINIIVTAKQSKIKSNYGNQIKRDFAAEPYQWDFAKDPQKAQNVVNAKVRQTSNGALKKFLEPGMYVVEGTYLLTTLECRIHVQ